MKRKNALFSLKSRRTRSRHVPLHAVFAVLESAQTATRKKDTFPDHDRIKRLKMFRADSSDKFHRAITAGTLSGTTSKRGTRQTAENLLRYGGGMRHRVKIPYITGSSRRIFNK